MAKYKKGDVMILELAKVGTWGSKENATTLTHKDLEEVVETFKGNVPITIGHTYADIMPAFGWVKKVEKKDGVLLGEVELTDVLKQAMELGFYKPGSIGIRINPEGKKYIHHVAFLGAVKPKIPDLKMYEGKFLADTSADEIWTELADVKLVSRAKLDWPIADPDTEWDSDGARKRLFEKGILDKCCAVIELLEDEDKPEALGRYHFPFCDIIDGKVMIIPKAVSSGIGYLNGARGVKVDNALAAKARPVLEKLHKRIQEKRKEEEENMADLLSIKNELETYKKLFKQTKIEELISAAKGKLPEGKHELLIALADALTVEQTIEFSDKETNKKHIYSAIDLLIELFKNIPLPVLPGSQFADLPAETKKINISELLNKI